MLLRINGNFIRAPHLQVVNMDSGDCVNTSLAVLNVGYFGHAGHRMQQRCGEGRSVILAGAAHLVSLLVRRPPFRETEVENQGAPRPVPLRPKRRLAPPQIVCTGIALPVPALLLYVWGRRAYYRCSIVVPLK